MARPVCTAYVARNEEIIQKYTQEGKSLEDLAIKYGLSKQRLRKILESQGVELRHEPRRSHIDRHPLNNNLVAMGARLHADRMKRKVSLAEYATILGLSETKLSEALQGLYNWHIYEVFRAADVLGITVSDFVKPPGGVNG